MSILIKIISFIIIITFSFAEECIYNTGDCSYDIKQQYFNENILTYYLSFFDDNNLQSQTKLFSYQVQSLGNDCNAILNIEYTLQIFSPEIGFDGYENFYNGIAQVSVDVGTQYFSNSDFNIGSFQAFTNSSYNEDLVSYLSQSGKLPNGQYLFQINIKKDDLEVCTFSNNIDINRPITLNLISPGDIFSDISSSIVYNTSPLFTWYSDYCNNCNYSIRVSEYNPDFHNSIHEALVESSILPVNQSMEYHELSANTFIYQSAIDGLMELEIGKFYVWQIRRSFNTTSETHYDYSQVYVFEIKVPTKDQIDFSDPYLSLIQTLIGEEKFHLLFSVGGELERFITSGESVWINDKEIHIDILHSLVNEYNHGIIQIEDLQIK